MQVDPATRPGTSCSVGSTMSSQMAYSVQGEAQQSSLCYIQLALLLPRLACQLCSGQRLRLLVLCSNQPPHHRLLRVLCQQLSQPPWHRCALVLEAFAG